MQAKGTLNTFKNFGFSLQSISKSYFSHSTFYAKNLSVELSKNKKTKPAYDNTLKFGVATTDHIMLADYDQQNGWEDPKIIPYAPFQIDPCNATLHYAIECFEGMKAFYGVDGQIRLFRPEKNMERMRSSMRRLNLPDFEGNELLACIKELIKVDKDWMPKEEGFSMYIRPTGMSMTNLLGVRASDKARVFTVLSPVGPYFSDGFKPLKIYAEKRNVRAFPGGVGHYKLGSNYGPTIAVSTEVEKKGYHQVLWLTDDKITEIGASNFCFLWYNEDGEKEFVTAPLDGLVLPGVTRDSVLTLAREKNQFKVSERHTTIHEFVKALKEKRVIEAFGCGTAVTVGPLHCLHYDGKDYEIPINKELNAGEFTKELSENLKNIMYGRTKHQWSVPIDDPSIRIETEPTAHASL
mmetsp:Transcript_20393/g.17711  ORF Transcript_20393/g.17711 Transcript_20393/m.17711 type:complete len:408 (-) Transcript_20393:871-2094(-)